jgi:hypothetical protein
VIPKRLEPALILLRDPTYRKHGIETLNRFKSEIKDKNFRIFAEVCHNRLRILKQW